MERTPSVAEFAHEKRTKGLEGAKVIDKGLGALVISLDANENLQHPTLCLQGRPGSDCGASGPCLPSSHDRIYWAVKKRVLGAEDVASMATITIELDDHLARHVEESARREHKSVSEWIKERLKAPADCAVVLAAMEARAVANGYPPGWSTLYATL